MDLLLIGVLFLLSVMICDFLLCYVLTCYVAFVLSSVLSQLRRGFKWGGGGGRGVQGVVRLNYPVACRDLCCSDMI